MGVKREVNTEPDDAFAAVFGDIDQSPVMRQSTEKAESDTEGHETSEEGEAVRDRDPEQAVDDDVSVEDPVSIDVAEEDGGRTFVPPGDIKGEVAQGLMAAFLDSLERDLTHYRLDLDKVREMDVSGLSVLVYCAQALDSRGRSLEIINANDDLSNLFRAGRLDKTYAVSLG